jgi:ABC-type glycerol-3-phosphate transport system substrate-binding protein
MTGLQRRLIVAVVGGLLVLGACGGSSNKNAATTTTTAPTTTLSPQQTKDAITKVFTDFFNGKNPDLNAKLQLLDNPAKFSALYNKFATDKTTGPELAGTSVTVTDVSPTGPDSADVTFTINLNGNPALMNQKGTATRVNGQWRVAGSTFCDLATLSDPSNASDPACA